MRERATGEYAELLSHNALFRGLDRVVLAKLAAYVEPVRMSVGETLFRQGDPADGLYLINHGRVGIYGRTPDGSREVRLATCDRGEAVGDIALLSGAGRTATVRAESDGELLRVDKARFSELVSVHPAVGQALTNKMIARLQAAEAVILDNPNLQPANRHERVSARAEGEALRPATQATQSVAPARTRPRPSRSTIGLALAVGLLMCGWIVPPPAGLSLAGWHALATVIATLPVFATNALPDAATALVLVGVWVLGGVASAPVALGGFASSTWVLVISVSAIGSAIASTGLLYRAALWLAAHTRGGFAGQVVSIGLCGLGFGQAIPDAIGRVTLLAPATLETAEALGYVPGSRAAAGLAMGVLVGFALMAAPFLTSSSTSVLIYALLPEAARAELSWGAWALRGALLHIVLFIGLTVGVLLLYRAGADRRHTDRFRGLAVQQALLGKPTRHEQVAGAVAVFLLVGLVTGGLHGISPTWVAVAGFVLLAATGVLTAQTLRAMNWSFLLLFGTLTSMAGVFSALGLDRWLEQVAAGPLNGLAGAPVLFVLALTLICFGLNLMLRLMVAAPLIVVAFAPVAAGLGISPYVVAIVALTACNGFLLPYQSNMYIALYHGTGGRLFSHAQARPMAVLYMVLVVVGLCLSVPVWHLMGLL